MKRTGMIARAAQGWRRLEAGLRPEVESRVTLRTVRADRYTRSE